MKIPTIIDPSALAASAIPALAFVFVAKRLTRGIASTGAIYALSVSTKDTPTCVFGSTRWTSRRSRRDMDEYVFTVVVSAHSREEAIRVIGERICFDEDYGFEYEIDYAGPDKKRFINHYRCPNDGTEWADEWDCMCNDKCPKCNAEIEPHESEEK